MLCSVMQCLQYSDNEGNKGDGLDWRAKQVAIQFLSRSDCDDDVVRQLRLYGVLCAHVRSSHDDTDFSYIHFLF